MKRTTLFRSANFKTAHNLTRILTNNFGGDYRVNFSLVLKGLHKALKDDTFADYVALVCEAKPVEEVKVVKECWEGLTEMETELMKAMVTNDYSNALEEYEDWGRWGEWQFAIVDEVSYSEQQAKGVISSLVKKELIKVPKNVNKKDGFNSQLNITETGYKMLKANFKY